MIERFAQCVQVSVNAYAENLNFALKILDFFSSIDTLDKYLLSSMLFENMIMRRLHIIYKSKDILSDILYTLWAQVTNL